jgi:putative ABC transport system ATP-binding protein
MLRLSNVSYKVSKNHTILFDVDLHIQSGDFVSILGRNGSGKSTLLKMICGTISPSYGVVERDYHPFEIRSVLQDFKLSTFDSLTVLENLQVAYYSKRHSIIKKPNVDFDFWLKKLNLQLENKKNIPLSSLSGGQRQAISLIMAAIVDPKVIILDEHTSALDPITSNQLMDMTHNICKQNNITTITVTHNLQHAIDYSDQIIVMEHGKIKCNLLKKENPFPSFKEFMKILEC